MDAERYDRVRELFAEALERPPGERSQFVNESCRGDPALREEVESLLAADREARRFLEQPAPGLDGRTPGRRTPGRRTADGRTPERRTAAEPASEAAGEDPHLGRRIGAYRIERCLGRGGMGAVYLAVRADQEFRRRAAVKLLKPGMDSGEIVRRFRTERQILAALDHPNIAKLLDGGTTEEGLPYFVMEYVDGERIDRYCDERGLGTVERLELFCSVCAAVHFAHQNLVVHRDLKPSNILVAGDGTPKLLDFGIAKLLAPELYADEAPTATVLRLMTPEYASPEQVRGAAITTAADVYSLGVVLYRLLTGRSPYRSGGGSAVEVVRRICHEEPEKPSTAVSRRPEGTGPDGPAAVTTPEPAGGVPGDDRGRLRRRLAGDLDNIVLKALRKEPHRRYASAEQLADDIRRHLDGLPVRARRATAAYRCGKFVRRHRVAVAVAAALFGVNLLFGVVMAVQRGEIARERDRARREQVRAERVSGFLVDLFEVADPYHPPATPPDARQLLDRGAERLEVELLDQPVARADLLETVGVIYRRLGLDEEALPLLESSLQIRHRSFGPVHPKVADSLQDLGDLFYSRGDYGAAESHYREALAMRRGEGARLDVADSLTGLAHVLNVRGERDEAEPLYREALAIRREILGDRHSNVADSLTSLASILWSDGDYGAAESLFREAVAVYRGSLGDEHPKTALALSNLALAWTNRGDYGAAESLYREALAIRRRRFGDDHPEVANSLTKLAALLQYTGELGEAEALYREALAIRRRYLGDDHRDVAIVLVNLAELVQMDGRYPEAVGLLREGIGIFRRALGESHPYVGRSLVNLAEALRRQGGLAAAEDRLREALEILRRKPGSQQRAEATALLSLARVSLGKGEPAAAEGHARAALEIFSEILPADHREVVEAEVVLADCLAALGRREEGELLSPGGR